MLYEDFIAKCYPDAGEAKKSDLLRWCKWIDSIATQDLKSSFQNSTFLVRCFTVNDTVSLSKSHYYKIRDYLKSLSEYLGVSLNIPSLPELISVLEDDMFKDLESILEHIDHIGNNLFNDYSPDLDLLYLKAIVILGWHGFSMEDVVSFKSENILVSPIANKYMISSPHIDLTQLEGELLLKQAKAVVFRSMQTRQIIYYVPASSCPYLLRPSVERAQPDKLLPNHIAQFFKFFNKISPRKPIVFRKLRKNAIFCEIHNDTSNLPLHQKILGHMRCSATEAYAIQSEYEKWLARFYSET